MSGIDNFLNKKGQSEYYITSQPANNAVNSNAKISPQLLINHKFLLRIQLYAMNL